MEARVFQQEHRARRHRRDRIRNHISGRVREKPDRGVQAAGQAARNGSQGEFGHDPAAGAPQVGKEHNPGARGNEQFDTGDGPVDAAAVGQLGSLDGNVEIGPDRHGGPGHIGTAQEVVERLPHRVDVRATTGAGFSCSVARGIPAAEHRAATHRPRAGR